MDARDGDWPKGRFLVVRGGGILEVASGAGPLDEGTSRRMIETLCVERNTREEEASLPCERNFVIYILPALQQRRGTDCRPIATIFSGLRYRH
jgi:hypothetical protein